ELRLLGHRRGGARPPQSVRRRGRGGLARRTVECGLQPAGSHLSGRAGRHASGLDPVLRAGRGVTRPLPDSAAPAGHHTAGDGGGRGRRRMINDTILVVIAASAIAYGTPLLFAALGELLAERSGVLNLGVEGMMLMGAVSGFWAVQTVGGPGWMVLLVAVLVAALVAAATSLIHAVLTISLRASQIVSGLALTIFAGASGLSSYVGHVASLGGQPARHEFAAIDVLGLKDLPIIGPILLHQNALTFFPCALVVLALFYLYRTRPGLHLRAVGESPATAD